MSFDHAAIHDLISAHGAIVRVVVAEAQGSAPREVGAHMYVWSTGQTGTIGGGALEFRATIAARQLLTGGAPRLFENYKLGPEIDQCCGGSVSLLSEVFTCAPAPDHGVFARSCIDSETSVPPLSVSRILARARDRGEIPKAVFEDGWLIEPIETPKTPVWIWGAGHVGRALIDYLSPLPGLSLTWIDTHLDRFPNSLPTGIAQRAAEQPFELMETAPKGAHHIVLTYSHPIDFSIVNAALHHGFAGLGLIGSRTKWARFSKHLAAKGHTQNMIERVRCPIGDKTQGKHPAALALGVAAQLHRDIMIAAHQAPRQKDENDNAAAQA